LKIFRKKMFMKIDCSLVPSDNEETKRTGTDIKALVVEEIAKTSLLMCSILGRELSSTTTNC
jgi:hypothetical protein